VIYTHLHFCKTRLLKTIKAYRENSQSKNLLVNHAFRSGSRYQTDSFASLGAESGGYKLLLAPSLTGSDHKIQSAPKDRVALRRQ
jgi:hypothetical protein